MTSTARRLPGIRFETIAPPSAEVLTRMDVAGFVGFAASGPLDVPVPVEDAAQFADVFGADAPLAWDAVRGEQQYAQLGPAVRAFFRNGGTRCWVVRVADADRAASDLFPLPGIAQVDAAGAIAPATLEARSPGSWADTTRVATRLESTPVALEEQGALAYGAPASSAVVAGDLVRVAYAGRPWTLLFTVGTVEGDGDGQLRIAGVDPVWLRVANLAPGRTGHVHFLGTRGERHVAAAEVSAVDASRVTRFALAPHGGRPFPPARAPLRGALVSGVFGSRTLWIEIEDVESGEDGGAVLVGTPVQVQMRRPAMRLHQAPGALAEIVTLTLRTDDDVRGPVELGGLGFDPRHPRFVGDLPTDGDLYAIREVPAEQTALRAAAAQPRFPLAAPAQLPQRYVPVTATILASTALPAIAPPGSARIRDGLRTFDPSVFVDAALAASRATVLLDDANFIRFRSPSPRPLRGMHALLGIDEVTIAAVPDAVQVGWLQQGPPVPQPAPPAPPAPVLDHSRFLDCTAHVPAAPALSRLAGDPAGVVTLTWTATDVAHATYELQEDVTPSFDGAETIWSGAGSEYAVYARPDRATLYFRVRAVAPDRTAGGWSNAVVVQLGGAHQWVVADSEEYTTDALVETHVALLRLCAARGDIFAVLALPEHLRERAAAAYAGSLRTAVAEPDVLSHGALYFPWLYASDPADPTDIRRTPPDGAAAGEIAARTLARGPWLAPANRPLRDVVALDPPLVDAALQQLYDAQVNVVRHDPGGFLTLAADTLSADDALRPIGVRRTLDMLRRVALLYGTRYVFEPNDGVLRRTVRRAFEGLLTRMFELGAFAGATPAQSFQVSVYAPQSGDEGLFVVELRVAPSRPLVFLTVRLTRTGAGALQVETR